MSYALYQENGALIEKNLRNSQLSKDSRRSKKALTLEDVGRVISKAERGDSKSKQGSKSVRGDGQSDDSGSGARWTEAQDKSARTKMVSAQDVRGDEAH